jgi:TatA/E family protein of Tat protein translocase
MDRLWYLIPIAVIAVLIIWGPSKLPEVGAGLGKAIREFRSAMSGAQDAVNINTATPPASPTATPPANPTATPPAGAAPTPTYEPWAPAPDGRPAATIPDDQPRV